jgi:hypothetical protein
MRQSRKANAIAQLQKTRDNAAVDIGNQATDAVNGLKSTIDNTKSNLYSMNATAADPLTAAAQARDSATAIVAPSAYPTLTDVFAGALAPFASGAKTNSQSMNPLFGPAPGNSSNGNSGSGYGRAVVGL